MISFTALCGSCKHQACCTNSSVPLVFKGEYDSLKAIGKSGEEYIQELSINNKKVKAVKKKSNSNICVFWDEVEKKCTIYENRPFDCRAYPFDILLVDGKYHWIVYSCNPDSDWKWSESYLQELEAYIEENNIVKDIATFAKNTELVLPGESHKTPFTILREVRFQSLK